MFSNFDFFVSVCCQVPFAAKIINMLYAHFPDANCFKKILDTIKHYKKLKFHFTQSGLCFQGMDNSKTSLLNVDLKAEIFDGYLCDKNVSAGIEVEQFYQMIKLAYTNGGITITDSDDENQFKVEFVSEAGAQRTIDLQHINVDEEFTGIPDLTIDSIATIPCSEFVQIVQEASLYFDSISVSNQDSDEIEILGKGSASTIKTLSTKIATTHSEDARKKIAVMNYNNFKRSYNLRLVKSIMKAANLSPVVTLNFCSNGVLLVEFKILEIGVMKFFLPDKFQEDEKIAQDLKTGKMLQYEDN